MNDTQLIIAIAYGAVTVVSLAIFWIVARSTRTARRGAVDADALAEREKTWSYLVIAFLVILLGVTITAVPYPWAKGDTRGEQLVRVDGQQFAWVIRPNVVRANTSVEFHIRSKDVQHNFALYRGNHRLEFQVQAPARDGGEQVYVHTFKTPGVYKVYCLEYCGLGHADMLSRLTVR